MLEARLWRIKIKDELQSVAASVRSRNQGLQAHPFIK